MPLALLQTFLLALVPLSNGAFAAQDLPQGSVLVPWASAWGRDSTDAGIGVVFFALKPGGGRIRADTLLIRGRPEVAAGVLGGFIYAETVPGRAWSYAVATPSPLRPNIVEFGYEEAGLPLDSISPDRAWGRAILGLAIDGGMFRGWVRLDSTRVHYRLWAEELPAHPLFVRPGVPVGLFDAPDGRELGIPLPRDASDYVMYPLDVRGPWMRVRLVRPSDRCGGGGAASDTAFAWIRYLGDRGRPTVWYHTRGC
jgi:hypothetical protein